MAISVTNGIVFMRQLLEDTNASYYAGTDAQYINFINERYAQWYKMVERRTKESTLTALVLNDHIVTQTTSTQIDEILSVNRVVSQNRTVGMERMEWGEIRNLQDYDSTTGAPTRYAVMKSTADEKWLVAVHPVPDASYTLNAVHTATPGTLTSGSTPVLDSADCYTVYRLAAYDVAHFIGRPDKAGPIVEAVPEAIRRKLGLEVKRLDPKRRDEEARV